MSDDSETPKFDLSKYLNWIQLSPRHAFVLWLPVTLVLFAPESWAKALGVEPLRESIRGWLGVGFLVTSAMLVGHGLAWGGKQWEYNKTERHHRNRLRKLSPREKFLLAHLLQNDRKTDYFCCTDGVVNCLETENVLFRLTTMAAKGRDFPYTVQPWAWDYLKAHPELLEGADGSDWSGGVDPYEAQFR